MPIYEYICQQCGEDQEVVHKMDEQNIQPCKQCGAPPEELEKALSVTAVHSSWAKWRRE